MKCGGLRKLLGTDDKGFRWSPDSLANVSYDLSSAVGCSAGFSVGCQPVLCLLGPASMSVLPWRGYTDPRAEGEWRKEKDDLSIVRVAHTFCTGDVLPPPALGTGFGGTFNGPAVLAALDRGSR